MVYVCMWGWGGGSKDFASKNEVKKKLSETCFWTKKNDCQKNRSTFFSTSKKKIDRKIFCWARKIFRDETEIFFDHQHFLRDFSENYVLSIPI